MINRNTSLRKGLIFAVVMCTTLFLSCSKTLFDPNNQQGTGGGGGNTTPSTLTVTIYASSNYAPPLYVYVDGISEGGLTQYYPPSSALPNCGDATLTGSYITVTGLDASVTHYISATCSTFTIPSTALNWSGATCLLQPLN
jgi:hypothetical protein